MLTIIIPTFNRHEYLCRAISYWQEMPFHVCVMDGSLTAYNGEIPSNIDYNFLPDLGLKERILIAASKVVTPYAVMCGDDDFLGYQGLRSVLDFLDKNKTYVSAQGRYIYFTVEGKARWYVEYQSSDNYHVSSDNVFERAQQGLNPYMHQSYSVMRVDTMRQAYSGELTQFNAMEINVNIISSLMGKHKLLPVFYGVRHLAGTISLDSRESFSSWFQNRLNMKEVSSWRYSVAKLFSEKESKNMQEGYVFFDSAIENYELSFKRKSKGLSQGFVRKFIKNILPEFFLNLYRSKHKPGFSFNDDLAMMNRYDNTSAYPNNAKMALEDWSRVKNIILMKEKK